jgi:hypothetical protein
VNINMLRDVDNDAGFYAAACGTSATWKGAVLFRADAGGAYESIATFTKSATMGQSVDALGDFHGGNVPDELNSIRVRLFTGELSSVTFENFINNAQAAVIGSEIVVFRNAVLNPDGTYTLSGFLRGRRGSEYATSGHIAGERFVLISPSVMVRIAAVSADIGRPFNYKAVTSGASLSSATAQSFTNEGAGLKPYAPVHVGGGRTAGDLIINWVRRSRVSGEWRDSVEVPLGEVVERYEIDVLNGSVVVRTISATSTSATYSAADQIADFGSVQSAIAVVVYQLSEIVGRGYPAMATI